MKHESDFYWVLLKMYKLTFLFVFFQKGKQFICVTLEENHKWKLDKLARKCKLFWQFLSSVLSQKSDCPFPGDIWISQQHQSSSLSLLLNDCYYRVTVYCLGCMKDMVTDHIRFIIVNRKRIYNKDSWACSYTHRHTATDSCIDIVTFCQKKHSQWAQDFIIFFFLFGCEEECWECCW